MSLDQEFTAMKEKLRELLSDNILRVWNDLDCEVGSLYDMDKLWNKGFGDWKIEYKYRRGGKTLCTFYAKKDVANILIIFGKAEREKFEKIKDTFSQSIQNIYEAAESFHDGKWLWIPLDEKMVKRDVVAMLKIKRKPNRK